MFADLQRAPSTKEVGMTTGSMDKEYITIQMALDMMVENNLFKSSLFHSLFTKVLSLNVCGIYIMLQLSIALGTIGFVVIDVRIL